MTKCHKDLKGGIFLKRGLFKGIKNYIPIQYKLEHLSFHSCTRSSFRNVFDNIWMTTYIKGYYIFRQFNVKNIRI